MEGRLISPARFFLRQMDPLERLFTGLTEELPVTQFGCFAPTVSRQNRRPWVSIVDLSGFDPKEISTKVESDSVNIHAKREIKDGSNVDFTERRRVVKLPEDVDKKKVSCHLDNDGTLYISAPYVQKEQQLPIGRETKCQLTHQKTAEGETSQPGSSEGFEVVLAPENSVRRTDDGLEVKFNMQGFKPENISVKFLDNKLCIDAKQEVNESGFYSKREYHRAFEMPENSNVEDARAVVSDSGVVNVTIPIRAAMEEGQSAPAESK